MDKTPEWVYFKAQVVLAMPSHDYDPDWESIEFFCNLAASVPPKCGRCQDILILRECELSLLIPVWCRMNRTTAKQTTDEEVMKLLEEALVGVPYSALAALQSCWETGRCRPNVRVLSVSRQAKPDDAYAYHLVNKLAYDLEPSEQELAETPVQADTRAQAMQ